MDNSDDLNWLEEWSGQELPEELLQLPPETTRIMRKFVESVYESKMKSVRKALKSNELTLKFIPTFIVHNILKNFVDPQMAALTTESLNINLILPIIKGLDSEYLANTAVYLNAETAAEILQKLDRKKVAPFIEKLLEIKPIKVLDILHHIPEDKILNYNLFIPNSKFVNSHLTGKRKEILDKFGRD